MRKLLIIIILYIFFPLHSASQLTLDSLPLHLERLLSYHEKSHSFDGEKMQRALHSYLDQFDPHKTLLLRQEVEEITDLSPQEAEAAAQALQKGNISPFLRAQLLIQRAWARSDSLQQITNKNLRPIIESAIEMGGDNLAMEKLLYPSRVSSGQGLLRRHYLHLLAFVQTEVALFGKDLVAAHPDRVWNRYQRAINAEQKRQQLVDERGGPLAAKEAQKGLALYILRAAVGGIDPHSQVLNSKQMLSLRRRLDKSFEGIGIEVKEDFEGYHIEKVYPNSPAGKSGLIAKGDRLVAVNGLSASALTEELLLREVRKPTGLTVELSLVDKEQQEKQISLRTGRVEIDEGRVRTERKYTEEGDLIGIITIDAFYDGSGVSSADDVEAALEELQGEGNLLSVVLDFRENSGGYLSEAVKMAGLFMKSGVVVVSDYNEGRRHFFRDKDPTISYKGPLVILTSKATASAAEIVAQSLQDYGLALLVGDSNTYGKGTIQAQNATETQEGIPFKVTVGTYYTTSGKSPQWHGVKTDILVPGPYENQEIGEAYLEGAPEARPDIAPSYEDSLADIHPLRRGWYQRNYLPHLQQPKAGWEALLPQLQAQSAERLANDSEYQELLARSRTGRYQKSLAQKQLEEAVVIAQELAFAKKAQSERE